MKWSLGRDDKVDGDKGIYIYVNSLNRASQGRGRKSSSSLWITTRDHHPGSHSRIQTAKSFRSGSKMFTSCHTSTLRMQISPCHVTGGLMTRDRTSGSSIGVRVETFVSRLSTSEDLVGWSPCSHLDQRRTLRSSRRTRCRGSLCESGSPSIHPLPLLHPPKSLHLTKRTHATQRIFILGTRTKTPSHLTYHDFSRRKKDFTIRKGGPP